MVRIAAIDWRRLSDRHGTAAAVTVWSMTFVVTVALTLSGNVQTTPYEVYAAAGTHWLQHQPLYELHTIDNFQYFPQAAMLFAPFAGLGEPTGGIAWRALQWTLLAFGSWRVSHMLAREHAQTCFFVATSLTVGVAAGALGNGQANLVVAAATLHVIADLVDRRWWRATVVLAAGLALKPLMAVLLLLAWALYRPMTWRLPLAVAVLFVAPWLFRDHDYVAEQYLDCIAKLGMSGAPDRLFEDLRGLVATASGWLMPHGAYLLVRLVAAVGALGFAAWVRAALREPYASILVSATAASYLMIFNPRTMSTSYVMTACIAALLVAALWLTDRRRQALAIAAVIFAWTVSHHAVPLVHHWLKPLACIVFVAMLAELALTSRAWTRAPRHRSD